MPIHVASTAITSLIPKNYYVPSGILFLSLAFTRAWANGRSNSRDRDMHGRVVLITGAFTPTGLVILSELAQRGAQVIALTPSLSSPSALELVPLLRTTTSNELIYAEQCDLESPSSMRQFCAKFLHTAEREGSKETMRLDAIVFAHEYAYIGGNDDEVRRERASLASFLLTTLLLPALLRVPTDRDIRLLYIVNPFYAASIPSFNPSPDSPSPSLQSKSTSLSSFTKEGYRSLRTIIFSRHLRRILNALAAPKPLVPDPSKPVVPSSLPPPKSNILSMAVCPGFSRSDIIAPFLRADRSLSEFSVFGLVLYLVLFPILYFLTKSPASAVQSVLYALFAPHPSKAGEDAVVAAEGGKLYRECEVVRLPDRGMALVEEEHVGRAVWEGLEKGLEEWIKEEKEADKGKQKEE